MLDAEILISIKYLSNFGRFLDLHLINCEIEVDLSWSKNSRISEISITPNPNANPPVQEVAALRTTELHFT